jgi:hypothetical protein
LPPTLAPSLPLSTAASQALSLGPAPVARPVEPQAPSLGTTAPGVSTASSPAVWQGNVLPLTTTLHSPPTADSASLASGRPARPTLPADGAASVASVPPVLVEHAAPASAREAPATKKLDIRVRELAIDKGIDFLLIFVGLYAALGVQKCQEASRERDEYVKLLADFRAELADNLKQRAEIEKYLGAVGERDPGKILGPMQATFDAFHKQATDAADLLGCVGDVVTIADRPRATEADKKRLEACTPLFEAADKGGDGGETLFKPVRLTPSYRHEVFDLYLAGGVKLFQNKELAVRIGEIYAHARSVEQRIAEIEKDYNDRFVSERMGEVEALLAALEDAVPKSEADAAKRNARDFRSRLATFEREMRGHRYAARKIHASLELKALQLKEVLAAMEEKLGATSAEIDAEIKRRQ